MLKLLISMVKLTIKSARIRPIRSFNLINNWPRNWKNKLIKVFKKGVKFQGFETLFKTLHKIVYAISQPIFTHILISWTIFNGRGYLPDGIRQIRAYLPDGFRQIRAYLPDPSYIYYIYIYTPLPPPCSLGVITR